MENLAFEQVLEGTFQCPADCDIYLQKLLAHLKRPDDLPPITMRTYAEYQRNWERARETTASSPSSLHFGHYIA